LWDAERTTVGTPQTVRTILRAFTAQVAAGLALEDAIAKGLERSPPNVIEWKTLWCSENLKRLTTFPTDHACQA
jgi:hypothetical protein